MRRVLFTVTALLAAAPVWAAEEGAGGFLGVPTLVWKIGNFVLFFGLLFYLLAKPLSKFFRTRRTQIDEQMKEAARQRQEAERLRTEMEGRIAALSGEISALRERMRRDGEREREALERQGEAEAARLASQVEQEAARRVEEARRQLASDAAQAAAQLAVELLQRELTPEDRERIFSTTLERLKAHPGGGAA